MDEPKGFDGKQIVFLLLLTLALRAWQIARTEVAARDSIGYIRIAWQLEHQDWHQVLPTAAQHPGYPVLLLGTSRLVRPFFPDDLAYAMQLSAQLASGLASVLLVLPLYFLGRELFDRRVAFWACLLFQFLPTSAKVMADGLSEPLFLLFAATALVLALVALRRGSVGCFALCGLAGGLAYLTRPEGAMPVLATGLVLLGVQAVPAWRRPWRRVADCAAGLALGALLVGGPFAVLIGGFTVKNTPNILFKKALGTDEGPQQPLDPEGNQGEARLGGTGPVLLAAWWTGPDPGEAGRLRWGLWTLANVLVRAFFYVAWLPALVGLWCFRERFRTHPGAWVLLLTGLMLGYALFRVAVVMGYLSERHTMLLLLMGLYWTVAGSLVLGRGLAVAVPRLLPARLGARSPGAAAWGLILLLALVVLPLPRTLMPLHVERTGFKEAGYWLAGHAHPEDLIVDPYCWSHFYSGGVFRENVAPAGAARKQPPTIYVVYERSANKHPRLQGNDEKELQALGGQVAQSWPVRRGKDRAEILVYEVPWARNPSP